MSADLMRTIAAAFAQSNLQPLLDALHEDIVWISASRDKELFSFHGEYKGRAGVLEALSNISKDYTFHQMIPKEILSVGDVVWGYFDTALSYDVKGKTVGKAAMQLDIAIRWQFKDGKIIEHQAFFDTAYLLMQQRSAQAEAKR